MTGVILAACAAALLAGAGPIWQRRRLRRRMASHSSALRDLGRSAEQGRTGPAALPVQPDARGWTAPPPAPPVMQFTPEAQPVDRPTPAGGTPAVGTPAVADPVAPAAAGPAGAGPARRSPRSSGGRPGPRLLAALGGVAALALIALAVTAVTSGGSHPYRRTAATGNSTTAPKRAAAPAPTATTALPPATTTPATTTPATTVPAGGGPAVTSISPAAGTAGQTVTISGSGLFSPSGVITVTFAGVAASVSCPSSTTCVATVPTGVSPSPAVPVVVDTGTGSSAPVPFNYP